MENQEKLQQELIITVADEAGRSFDCTVLTSFNVDGIEYIALLHHYLDEEGNVNIQLFRYSRMMQEGQEGIELTPISSDKEFNKALAAFETLVESD